MNYKVAPLSGGFFLLSMLGFFTAIFLILPIFGINWTFVIGGISVIMFFASVISMTGAPVEEELMIDEPLSKRSQRVKILSKKEYLAREQQKEKKAKAAKAKRVVLKKPVTKKTVVKKKSTAKRSKR